MSNDPKDQSYFAPATDTVPPVPSVSDGEGRAWGQDAEEIARAAGLGSYDATMLDQQVREEALLHGLERVNDEVSGLRALVGWMAVCVAALGSTTAWLVWHALHTR